MCRKSTLKKRSNIKDFKAALDGGLIHFLSIPENGPLTAHGGGLDSQHKEAITHETITTELPPYFFFPWFLLDMDSSYTVKLTYVLLLDRARLSQHNNWTDEAGKIYIIFPIEKIAERLSKNLTTIKSVLAELEAAGLIERKRQHFSKPNHIYVKLPDGQKISRP